MPATTLVVGITADHARSRPYGGTAGQAALDAVDISGTSGRPRAYARAPAAEGSRIAGSTTTSHEGERDVDMQIYFLPKPLKSDRQFEIEVARLPLRRQLQRRIVKHAQCGQATDLLRLLRDNRRVKLNRAYGHYAFHDRLTRTGKKKRGKQGPKLTPLSWAALNGHADCVRMLLDGVPGDDFPGVFLFSESTVGSAWMVDPQSSHNSSSDWLHSLSRHHPASSTVSRVGGILGSGSNVFPSTWASTNVTSTSSIGGSRLFEQPRVPRADIEAVDGEGRTALMFAVYAGHADVVKVLLERGADILRGDKCYRNSLSYAKQSNRLKIEAMLKNELQRRKHVEAERKLEEERQLRDYYARIMKQKKRPSTATGSVRRSTTRRPTTPQAFDGRPSTASWGRRRSAAMLQSMKREITLRLCAPLIPLRKEDPNLFTIYSIQISPHLSNRACLRIPTNP